MVTAPVQPDLFSQQPEMADKPLEEIPEPAKQPAEPVEEKVPRKKKKTGPLWVDGSPFEGPYYRVSLQDAKDLACFKCVHETNNKDEAIAVADAMALEEKRDTIVSDRFEMKTIYRVTADRSGQPAEPVQPVQPSTPPKRKGKK